MMLIKVVNAKYVDGYKVNITFNDGLTATVDLKDKIFSDHRAVFKPLRDINYFKTFTQNRWTIEWGNELDLAPEFLHELAIEQNKNIRHLSSS